MTIESSRSTRLPRSLGVAVLAAALLLASCGDADETATEAGQEVDAATQSISVVSAEEANTIIESAPADLVVLDVRTQDEYDEGHLAGAVMVDFYAADFADQLATLDPTVPYVVYCRSGNRSGQAREMMNELGFLDVRDVEGGIISWTAAGLPTE